jgi:hypothetical protein
MTRKRILALAILALVGVPWATTEASVRVFVGVGVPAYYRPYPYRVIVAPPPIIVAPAPVVYVQPVPAPVYVQPAPVYVRPAPTVVQPPPPVPNGYQNLPPQPVPYR